MISYHRLIKRKSALKCDPDWPWIMDSGAFSTILIHGKFPDPPEAYADAIPKWKASGHLLAAVTQDFMCEPMMLAKTGGTIAIHQAQTIRRYDRIIRHGTGGVYLMPVLQGYEPADYVNHLHQYGARLAPEAWVGVGSVCKRNANPASIEEVLLAISRSRPDLRLHGFGIKTTALGSALVRDLLHSADSMAWSYAARMNGANGNDWREADRFAKRIDSMPVQGTMAGDW